MPPTAFSPDFAAAAALSHAQRFPCDVRRGRRLRNSLASSTPSIGRQRGGSLTGEAAGEARHPRRKPVLVEHRRATRLLDVKTARATALPLKERGWAEFRYRPRLCENALARRFLSWRGAARV